MSGRGGSPLPTQMSVPLFPWYQRGPVSLVTRSARSARPKGESICVLVSNILLDQYLRQNHTHGFVGGMWDSNPKGKFVLMGNTESFLWVSGACSEWGAGDTHAGTGHGKQTRLHVWMNKLGAQKELGACPQLIGRFTCVPKLHRKPFHAFHPNVPQMPQAEPGFIPTVFGRGLQLQSPSSPS